MDENRKNNHFADAEFVELPMIPLRGLSVFPNMVLHFDIGREKSINALEKAMVNNQYIFLSSQMDENTDLPTPDDFYKIGTIGKIKQMLKLPGDSIRVLVEGHLQRPHRRSALRGAVFQMQDPEAGRRTIEEPDSEAEALMRTVLANFDEYINLDQNLAPEILHLW